jgi:hypothetical protein
MGASTFGVMMISERIQKQIDNNFIYHAPRGGQVERITYLRKKAKEFAEDIAQQTPESREQSLALTNLEEAVMWANAAIVRNENES